MLPDRFRPYHKCLARRYVIVGVKQIHALQLWVLILGRLVLEVNFPQESDTDALCSAVYQPLSGIIVVGNTTRNSIYFIHLSPPRYSLPTLSPALYIKSLATKDRHSQVRGDRHSQRTARVFVHLQGTADKCRHLRLRGDPSYTTCQNWSAWYREYRPGAAGLSTSIRDWMGSSASKGPLKISSSTAQSKS